MAWGSAAGVLDAQEPLLPKQSGTPRHPFLGRSQLQQGAAQQQQQQQQQQRQKPQQPPTVDLGSRFLCRLWRIMCIIQAAPALVLVLVSLAETVIVSKIGTISGLFYQVFVDGEASKVTSLMWWSAGCYTATALFFALKSGLQDLFAWRWRASLTLRLQGAYCSSIAATCPRSRQPLLQSLDTPDQRLAQDLPLLTSSLSEVLTQLAAVPFNIAWYTHLTHQVFGSWLPVGCAYLFFLAGAVLQRLVMLPVASAVFDQEAAEGGLRYSHTRFRARAADIALYRAQAVEQQHLEHQLGRVLLHQGRLVLRRAVLTASSRLLDYSGLVVNFGCLAAAVFGGAWAGSGGSAGDLASKVSVASFYLLTLIYNFSQVLDLASKVANLAGLTARVGQMMEVLDQQQHTTPHATHKTSSSNSSNGGNSNSHTPSMTSSAAGRVGMRSSKQAPAHFDAERGTNCPVPYSSSSCSSPQRQQQRQLQEVAAGRSPSHQRFASQAVLLQPPQLLMVPAPCSGQAATAAGTAADAADAASAATAAGSMSQHDVMQVSIHSMGADMLLQEVRGAFPDSPRLAPLLAVMTFQFCGAASQLMRQQLATQQQQQGQRSLLPPPAGVLDSSSSGGDSSRSRAAGVAASSSGGSSGGGSSSGCCPSCDTGSAGREGTGATEAAASVPAAAAVCGSWQGLCSDGDMQHMLAVFLHWQQTVYDFITSRGYWADTIDPRTGTALHGTPGSHYDEVIGASVLLGYDRVTPPGQTFSLISHPVAATQVYPATLFTSAPLPLVKEALRAAAASSQALEQTAAAAVRTGPLAAADCSIVAGSLAPAQPCVATTSSSGQAGLVQPLAQPCVTLWGTQQQVQTLGPTPTEQQAQMLLRCVGLSVRAPSGVPVVTCLDLQVAAGRSLLIQGPSGCGKSTLLNCWAGLWPAESGLVQLPAPSEGAAVAASAEAAAAAAQAAAVSPVGVMFVPQRPLAGPGVTLRQQLLYPAAAHAWPCCCCRHMHSSNNRLHMSQQALLQQQQQQMPQLRKWQQLGERTAAAGGRGNSSSTWWLDWLSCGLYQQPQQQQVPAPLQLPVLPLAASKPQHKQQQQWGNSPCASCQQLTSVLDAVGLSYLLAGLHSGLHTQVESWGDVLSPGELQRLAFARVLLHKPVLAVLDEATSSLPDAAAVQLYQLLQQAGISYVSVGHSSCLTQLHDSLLSITGDGSGSWCMC